jgi:hypothetical protein
MRHLNISAGYGELLALFVKNIFELIVTIDLNLPYQPNLAGSH